MIYVDVEVVNEQNQGSINNRNSGQSQSIALGKNIPVDHIMYDVPVQYSDDANDLTLRNCLPIGNIYDSTIQFVSKLYLN